MLVTRRSGTLIWMIASLLVFALVWVALRSPGVEIDGTWRWSNPVTDSEVRLVISNQSKLQWIEVGSNGAVSSRNYTLTSKGKEVYEVSLPDGRKVGLVTLHASTRKLHFVGHGISTREFVRSARP